MTESYSELEKMLIRNQKEIEIAEQVLLTRLASDVPMEDLIPGNEELRQKIDRLRLEEGIIIVKMFVSIGHYGNS